jgi:hypothetical protein
VNWHERQAVKVKRKKERAVRPARSHRLAVKGPEGRLVFGAGERRFAVRTIDLHGKKVLVVTDPDNPNRPPVMLQGKR